MRTILLEIFVIIYGIVNGALNAACLVCNTKKLKNKLMKAMKDNASFSNINTTKLKNPKNITGDTIEASRTPVIQIRRGVGYGVKESFAIMYVEFVPFANCLLCFCLFGFNGLWSYLVGFAAVIATIRLSQQRILLAQIKEILRFTTHDPIVVNRASKEFLKEFNTWIKPGRDYAEYYSIATTILKQYKKQLRVNL